MQENSEIFLLKEEVRQLREELNSFRRVENNVEDDIRVESEEVIREFQEEFEKIKFKSSEISLELQEQIKEKPLQSLAVAFGVGLFLSKFFGGNK